jgi:glucokinase
VELVTADIGGSHARFALANVENGQVTSLGKAVTFRTVEHASLQTAWARFGEQLGRSLPRAAAIAVACPIAGEMLKLTNNPWIIRPAMICDRLGLDRVTLINDFGV